MGGGGGDGRFSGTRGGRQRGKGRQSKGTPGNNKVQNKQVDDIAQKLGLTDEQRQRLHREISKMRFDYHEIIEHAREMFKK